jgi:hypothetical protein
MMHGSLRLDVASATALDGPCYMDLPFLQLIQCCLHHTDLTPMTHTDLTPMTHTDLTPMTHTDWTPMTHTDWTPMTHSFVHMGPQSFLNAVLHWHDATAMPDGHAGCTLLLQTEPGAACVATVRPDVRSHTAE